MTDKENKIVNEAVKRIMSSTEEIYHERDVIWLQALQKYVYQNVAITFYHKEILHDFIDSKDLEIMALKKELKDHVK